MARFWAYSSVNDNESSLYYLQSRYYDPTLGRFINADNYPSTGQGLLGNNMFAYCNNNPVVAADPSGEAFFLVVGLVGAVVGAVAGGCIAANNGGSILSGIAMGALAGGLLGLGVGAAAGALLAGSVAASTASVVTGANALGATIAGGGLTAGGLMLADNFSQSIHHAPQVFWSGGDVAKNAAKQIAQSINGITLEMTKLGQHLEQTNASWEMWKAASQNYANVASNAASAVHAVHNAAGVKLQSIWATIEYPLVQLRDIVYHVVN